MPGAPKSRFRLQSFYFSCRDGVYSCAVPKYSGGNREVLCCMDKTNKIASGEALSRSLKTMFFFFYDQKTPSWNSELMEINLGNTRPRKKVDIVVLKATNRTSKNQDTRFILCLDILTRTSNFKWSFQDLQE